MKDNFCYFSSSNKFNIAFFSFLNHLFIIYICFFNYLALFFSSFSFSIFNFNEYQKLNNSKKLTMKKNYEVFEKFLPLVVFLNSKKEKQSKSKQNNQTNI